MSDRGSKARREIEEYNQARSVQQSFEAHLSKAADVRSLEIETWFSDAVITVKALGFTVKSVSRAVRTDSGSYCIEYAFLVPFQGEDTVITQFYVLNNGIVSLVPVDQVGKRVCDYNNEYIRTHIAMTVLDGLIISPIMKPLVQVADG